MGFWHTGYMEFHEEVGLGDSHFRPEPTVYRCKECDAQFDAFDALRAHRFEAHPYRTPLLLVRGIEAGATPIRVTRPLAPADIVVGRAQSAALNGRSVPLSRLPKLIAEIQNDRVSVGLENDGVRAEYELDITIANDADLAGVEKEFVRLASGRSLTVRAIEAFIAECRRYASAETYFDAVCHYLYGVLAKEQAPDSSLRYEVYRDRFNRAADALRDIERPLARIIRGLVEFHFNHYSDAAAIAPAGRLRAASQAFFDALSEGEWRPAKMPRLESRAEIEDLLTDHETLRILRWAGLPLHLLAADVEMIESLLRRDLPEYDRMKLRVLFAEAALASGDLDRARRAAREAVGVPRTVVWAENLLARIERRETSP